jgi:ELWxxDGT repeat protein
MLLLGTLVLGCGGTLSEEDGQEEQEASTALGWSPATGSAQRVKDIFPPVAGPGWWGPYPESLVAFRGKLFFAANFEDGRSELWKSDGTPAGTVPVKKFPALPSSGGVGLESLTVLGSKLFFVVTDAAHGRDLWVTNGTEAGTRLVKDLTPADSYPYALKAVGGRLLFFRYLPETPTTPEHHELWRTDGTAAGTVLVKDLGPGTSLSVYQAVVKNTLFFVLTDLAHGTELWKTDGTAAGTGLVKDIVPGTGGSYPGELRVLGGRLFFSATDTAHGHALWRTDGTVAGTQLAADPVSGPDDGLMQVLSVSGNRLYFALRGEAGPIRLYSLKDNPHGVSVKFVATLPVPAEHPDTYLYITTSTSSGGKLYLAMAVYRWGPAPIDEQLWVSDGTAAGTKLLHRPLSRYDEFGSSIFRVADRVLFTGHEDSTGLELWVSDGTPAGTRLLQDIAPGFAASFARDFVQVGLQVFFIANDRVHGNELWVLQAQETNTRAAE